MAVYSHHFASLYDSLMGDYGNLITLTQKLIKRYAVKKKSLHVLELACGTGNILKELPKEYILEGLDNSTGMLEVAKKKVPSAVFHYGDMSNFNLKKQFDAIICIFDSINHLLSFRQWQKMFGLVAKHLDTNGVFIFDINTPLRLETLASFPAYVKKQDDMLMCVKIIQTGQHLFDARFEIFDKVSTDKVTCLEEDVYEITVPVISIEKALKKYFTLVKMIDPSRPKVIAKTGRIFFVCRKK